MEDKEPVPDGGWGWVIVTCSFLIHMFVVGTMYALSVLYVAWLDYFGDSKGITSWIISLAVAVMFGIGPVPGALSRRIGNRAVVVIGGALMSCGFILSYFAVSVYFLVVSIGIIAGTGAGCCYLPSVSMVAMYFTSKRSIAMGIATSGLGAGAFCMAPFLDWLVDYYGWRGSMLILAGVSLNMCVLGMLMHPLKQHPDLKSCFLHKNKVNSSSYHRDKACIDLDKRNCKDDSSFIEQEHCVGSCRNHDSSVYSQLLTSEPFFTESYYPVQPGMVYHHNCLNNPEGNQSQSVSNTSETSVSFASPELNKHLSRTIEPNEIEYYQTHSLPGHTNPHKKILAKKVGGSMEILASTKLEALPSGKLYSSQLEVHYERQLLSSSIPVKMNTIQGLSDIQFMLAGSIGSLVFMDKTTAAMQSSSVVVSSRTLLDKTSPDTSVHKVFPVAGVKTKDNKDYLKDCCTKLQASLLTYIKLVKDGTFLVFGVSNFLTNLSFFMPVLYMVDRAVNSGIKKGDAAMLVSLYGAGNIFGKLFFGWLADRKLMDRLLYYIACLTACGAATCASPLSGSSLEMHIIYAFSFGCFIGAYVTLVPVVTVDLMGLSLVTESYGLLLCFMGIATAFGTPVAGLIFDWTGSYVMSFILHGIFLLISAFMLFPLLVLKRRKMPTRATET